MIPYHYNRIARDMLYKNDKNAPAAQQPLRRGVLVSMTHHVS